MGAASPKEFAETLAARLAAGESVAVATVVRIEGSASAKPGAKAIIDAQGRTVFGWIGGGCAESTVRDVARELLAQRGSRLVRLDLDDEVLGVGMPCGGYMEVYVEAMMQAPKLLVLGHGQIAETLVRFGHALGFHTTVNDPLATPEAFPDADVRVTEDPDYAKAECDSETFVAIATQHKTDYEALQRVLRQSPAYVGLVASRKRSALVLERLHEDGMPVELLRRVAAPAGLDLGAETPQEIALSILAEVVQHWRGAKSTGQPLMRVKGVQITEAGVLVPEGPLESAKCPS
ncbi:MAG TPA: XdhC family protein [Myxococcota bacterium]|nr:XdhC family protein [Myxococcota bacterium]